jgi:tetratricopeptide (TPR) repeat protein
LIAAAALWAYGGTFSAPFVFDDDPSIAHNASIRHLGDLGAVLSPPSTMAEASGVTGRPIINFSLAVNYALGGLEPRGYHVVNLAIHLGAALALFGIVRRTLAPRTNGVSVANLMSPTATALAAALLWAMHPLLTESVTCIIQRTESLMGLCYLMTLYFFIRYAEAGPHARFWAAASVLGCLLGMAAKEAMVTAPIVVFLYDRTFVSGTFRESWKRHGRLHLALAATWMLLVFLVLREGGNRGDEAGFGHGVSSWNYLLTQCRAIVLYLRLSIWPAPLVLDYGTGVMTSLGQVWPDALFLIVLFSAASWALFVRPVLGFLGFSFYLILSPSSSFVPLVSQTVAEHRMYLPLAIIVVLFTLGTRRWTGRLALPLCLVTSVALAWTTVHRNHDYSSNLLIWEDTVAKAPGNVRAHNQLGMVWVATPGGMSRAISEFEEALRIQPDYFEAHLNLGNALAQTRGRLDDAILQFREALRLRKDDVDAHVDLAGALARVPGHTDEMIAHFQEAQRLNPRNVEARSNFGGALLGIPGRHDEAIKEFQAALDLRPESPELNYNLGNALATAPGRMDEAIARYEEALRLRPNYLEAHNNLGGVLMAMPGRLGEALEQFQEALRIDENYAEAHYNMAIALCQLPGRSREAQEQLEAVMRLQPNNRSARQLLQRIRGF